MVASMRADQQDQSASTPWAISPSGGHDPAALVVIGLAACCAGAFAIVLDAATMSAIPASVAGMLAVGLRPRIGSSQPPQQIPDAISTTTDASSNHIHFQTLAGETPASAVRDPIADQHEWTDVLHLLNHDLRTPLNAVIGFSDVMQHEMFGPLGDQRYQQYVKHIRESGSLLLKAAEDTLAVTTIIFEQANAPRSRVDLRAVIEAAHNLQAERMEASVLQLRIDDDGSSDAITIEPAIEHAIGHILSYLQLRYSNHDTLSVKIWRTGERVQVTLTPGHQNVAQDLLPVAVANGTDDWSDFRANVGARAMSLAALLIAHSGGKLRILDHKSAGETIWIELAAETQHDFLADYQ